MHSHIFLRTRLENLPFTTTTARRAARERLQCTEMHRATYGRECAALRRFRQPADDFFVSARKFSPPPIRHGTVGLRGRQSKYTKVSEVSSRPTSNFAILIVALRCWFSFSTTCRLAWSLSGPGGFGGCSRLARSRPLLTENLEQFSSA